MEQVIFLHSDEEIWAMLDQVQQSTAQHLILVLPLSLDQLRLSMLLRLVRRSIALQGKQLSIVSEDRLVRVLAERMGCTVAATLDEHDGLAPGRVPSLTKRAWRGRKMLWFASRARRHTDKAQTAPQQEQPEKAVSLSLDLPPGDAQQQRRQAEETSGQQKRQPLTGSQGSHSRGTSGKPSANLDAILVDGYLPNPAATPGLDEEEERTAGEEAPRLHYEIADDTRPSQAQQAAEDHEARITARIRKTSAPGTPTSSASPPIPTRETHTTPDAPTGSAPAAEASEIDSADDTTSTVPHSVSEPFSLQDSRSMPFESASPTQSTAGRLRPMRSIDELLQERGRESPLDWFEE